MVQKIELNSKVRKLINIFLYFKAAEATPIAQEASNLSIVINSMQQVLLMLALSFIAFNCILCMFLFI
jgi:hypothetical protein